MEESQLTTEEQQKLAERWQEILERREQQKKLDDEILKTLASESSN